MGLKLVGLDVDCESVDDFVCIRLFVFLNDVVGRFCLYGCWFWRCWCIGVYVVNLNLCCVVYECFKLIIFVVFFKEVFMYFLVMVWECSVWFWWVCVEWRKWELFILGIGINEYGDWMDFVFEILNFCFLKLIVLMGLWNILEFSKCFFFGCFLYCIS